MTGVDRCQDPGVIHVDTRRSLEINGLSSVFYKPLAFMNVDKYHILRQQSRTNCVATTMYSFCVWKSVRTAKTGAYDIQNAVRRSTLRLDRDEQ
jgi:hypothetical protein